VTTLVLGHGTTGRRVIERLEAHGNPLRVLPHFDWHDQSSWAPALHDVEAIYLGYPARAVDAVGPFAASAVACGVRRIVLLSPRGDPGALPAEQGLRASGADWTIVRASLLDQTFSEGCLAGPVRVGEVALPARRVGEPFVDAGDVADVVVAALTGEGVDRRVYEATGPRLLTFAEAVEELAAAMGREIRYVQVTPRRYGALLAEQDVPEEVVARLMRVFGELLDGRNARVSPGVERAIGREPRDFSDYARDAASTGIWEET
jgi:uncharacterized protein YbjT (DUF2867 family)